MKGKKEIIEEINRKAKGGRSYVLRRQPKISRCYKQELNWAALGIKCGRIICKEEILMKNTEVPYRRGS